MRLPNFSAFFLIQHHFSYFDTTYKCFNLYGWNAAKIIINILIYKHLRLFNPPVGRFSFLQLAVFHSYSWPIFVPTVGHHVLYCSKNQSKSIAVGTFNPLIQSRIQFANYDWRIIQISQLSNFSASVSRITYVLSRMPKTWKNRI